MPTHEPELTAPVDLCLPDGRTLAPRARGFSRRILHRANLGAPNGRTKRWDYWSIRAGDRVVSVTYADLDYLGLVDVWWADVRTGQTGGRSAIRPLARDMSLPSLPGASPIRFSSRDLTLELANEGNDPNGATRIRAVWKGWTGLRGALDVVVAMPEAQESLNVVIPWSDTLFQFTSKHQARPVQGALTIGDATENFGDAHEAWACLDVGRGIWPYATHWNWGGGAGRAQSTDGSMHVVGLQLGGKWTRDTGFTENGFFVDGRLTKLGHELEWTYDWDHPLRPWRVRDLGGALDVTLVPTYDRHSRAELGVLGTHVHQVFGTWSGRVTTDEGVTLTFDKLGGFAEESRSRW